MINAVQLESDEVEALRGLQGGQNVVDANDPVWEELAELGLVERRTLVLPGWSLTMRGRLYKTD
jgi:hypothetical protein